MNSLYLSEASLRALPLPLLPADDGQGNTSKAMEELKSSREGTIRSHISSLLQYFKERYDKVGNRVPRGQQAVEVELEITDSGDSRNDGEEEA